VTHQKSRSKMAARRLLFLATVFGLLFPSFAFASINLVANGSFETGDFTSWERLPDYSFTGVVSGTFSGISPTDGSFQAYFGTVGDTGGIQQALSSAATSYNVSFDLFNFGGTPSSAAASLSIGNYLLSLSDPPAFGYTTYTFQNVAAGVDPTLAFTFRQDPSYFLLDNVSVSATPEPGFYGLLALGLSGLGVFVRRRSRS
jgi:hypothetical protein